MAEAPSELELAFERLAQHTHQGQDAKVLKAADAVLKLAPGDADALACKVVAHLQLGEYEDAARVLAHKSLVGKMQFERAYACYRLGKFDEALKLLPSVPEEQSSGALQLAAQVCFRLDRGQECVDAVNKLQAAGQLSGMEQKTNLLAAYVSAGLSAQLPELMKALGVKPRDSFEIGFNRAVGLASLGELEAAETAVKAAYKQGEEALFDEEFTEEEVLAELAPLTVLLAFLLLTTGRPAKALDRLQPLVAGDIPAREVAALAANNWAVASHATDASAKGFFARSIRKLESLLADKGSTSPGLALEPELATRLSAPQQQLLHLNRALLYLMSGKTDQAKQLAAQLAAAYPGSVPVTMLQAALLAKAGKAAEADKLLAGCAPLADAGDDPAAAARPVLLRAQLALEAGNAAHALQLLGSGLPGDLALRPGVVATRAALHEQTGDVAGAEALLQSALRHYQGAAKGDAAAAAGVGWCLQRLVALKLAQGAASDAMALYQQLTTMGGPGGSTSAGALAKLARAAAAAGDAGAIAALQKQLPASFANLGAGLDLDALEDSARAMASTRRREEPAASRKREADEPEGDAERQRKKTRKKRKPRYPQGYDPTKPNGGLPPPDPERWLPKWQRSDAKKKQRRRRDRQETVKGSQGAGKVDEALDRAAKADRGEEPEKAKGPARPNLPARPKGKGRK
ncbi:srp72 [Scenedesmus sp. PABB004]|nr:srp72 [Scenedesmus sp. PABB004]